MKALEIVIEGFKTIFLVIYQVVLSWLKFVYTPRKDLNGEVVVLTGAAGGLGQLLTRKLAKKGCVMVLLDINESEVNKLADEINKNYEKPIAHAFKCDITNEIEVERTCDRISKVIGSPTILINNAAIVTGKYITDMTQQEFKHAYDVNVICHHRLVKRFLPTMLENNHGHIVCTSSILALDALAGVLDYGSSKAGATAYMQALRQEIRCLGKDGVYCTTVFPYQIHTDMFKGCSARFPNLPLLGILDPDYVTAKMVDAIEKNQIVLYIPRILYFVMVLSSVLPIKAVDLMHDFLMTNTAMKNWTGRTEKKIQ